mmetsp:Transcript_1422/g.2860  ORF Transcript_1422/g.2860 Transcript_1422/m.2860 type:complete len:195 (+) Transcript_1422:48-632(+)
MSSLQHLADSAAARSPAEKKTDGENSVKIVEAVKEALGGSAQVLRSGSDKKATDIAESDIDNLVVTGTPVTPEDIKRVFQNLKVLFPDGYVDDSLHTAYICVRPAKGKDIDVKFQNTPGDTKALPKEHFKNNQPAQTAIRVFKAHLAEQGLKTKGVEIERCVIDFLQANKGCNAQEILEHLCKPNRFELQPRLW